MKPASALAVLTILATMAAPTMAQAWRDRIDVELAVERSYNFKEMAFGDIIKLIASDTGVNVIMDDSYAAGIDASRKMTFKFADMATGTVLTWVTRMAGLVWIVEDEAIFITSYDRLDGAGREQLEKRSDASRAAALKTWVPQMQQVLASSRGVNFSQKNLGEVRDSLQALLGVNVLLSPNLNPKTPVSVAVSSMSAENVISWVARKANCDFAVTDNAVYFAPTDELRPVRAAGLDFSPRGRAFALDLVSFDYAEATVQEAFDDLARKSGMKIVLRSEVEELPRVTVARENVPLQAAVQAVINATGLNNAVVPQGETITVQLFKPAPVVAVPEQSTDTQPAADAPAQG